MDAFFAYVDAHQEEYIARLAEAVAIDSVSAEPERRPKVLEMVDWTAAWATKLGAKTVAKVDIGTQNHPSGQVLPLPPILLIDFGHNPSKRTVCVYGHLDVQPANKSDGWDSEPFVLTERDGALWGRGATDDKGPVIGWFWAIEAYHALGLDIPVNIKMCLEGMEEAGSEGLDELIFAEATKFFGDVDYFCISDNYWLGKKKPCITYGLRGICYFMCEIEGSTKDLHSGVFGGTVHEPMIDLSHIFASLVDSHGHIQIPGISELVRPLTDAETQLYKPIDFDPEEFRQETGAVGKLIHDSKEQLLMHRWRYPSLSIHGVEGAFYGSGCKTVIPRKVTGKFSIRLVPDMTPDDVTSKVKEHVEGVFAKLNSPNKLRVFNEHGGKPFLSDISHPNYVAGARAIKAVYGVEPDFTREGGSIPVAVSFQVATGKNVMLLPIGRSDDGAHSQNEKLDRLNYINGIKLLGAYFTELSKLA